MEFVESQLFTRLVNGYLDDAQYRLLQVRLAADPEAGAVIPGTGGIRKLRWGDARRGKGRRGGLRVVYYLLRDDGQIWLLTLYDKDEIADLTAQEKRALKEAIEAEESARRARRTR